jgi:hypothetical protein
MPSARGRPAALPGAEGAARRGRVVAPWLALVLVIAAWLALRAVPTAWIEARWLTDWLPWASRVSAAAIDAVPLSLTALSAAIVALGVGLGVWSGRRRGQRHRWVWVAAAVLTLGPAFEWSWGMAYRRSPLEVRLALPTASPKEAALWAAFDRLAAYAHADAPDDLGRLARDAPWWTNALVAGSACVAEIDVYVSQRPVPLRLPTAVRRLPAGTLLSGGFSGVQAPWWREPHVDGGLPPAAALATGLHEVAHAAGWAGEAETDAIAMLAGLACDDADVRFATALHALQLVRAELRRLPHPGPDAQELAARWAALPEAAHVAWEAAADAVRAHRRAPVQRAAEATYGVYLRSHGVEAGMADYGRASVLLVAAFRRCSDEAGAPWCGPGQSSPGEEPPAEVRPSASPGSAPASASGVASPAGVGRANR